MSAENVLPLSPKERIAYTPPHLYSEANEQANKPKPVIWLRPMSVMDRARWKAAVSATGCRVVTDREMAATRREIYPLLEMGEQEIDAIERLYELAIESRNEGRELDRQTQSQLEQLEILMVGASERYRMLVETRALYIELAPLLALQMQCIGWQNLPHKSEQFDDGRPKPAKFERANGRVTEAALDQVDPFTLLLAGLRAMGLGQVSEGDAKKSASPSS